MHDDEDASGFLSPTCRHYMHQGTPPPPPAHSSFGSVVVSSSTHERHPSFSLKDGRVEAPQSDGRKRRRGRSREKMESEESEVVPPPTGQSEEGKGKGEKEERFIIHRLRRSKRERGAQTPC